MRVSIIAAVAENGVIGRDGKLPWHLSADLRRFKQLTMGHTIIMGRRTWESIARPLPGRRMIVVSRQPGYRVGTDGVEVSSSLSESLSMVEEHGGDEAFVIGGAELYKEAIPRTDRMYLTQVGAAIPGDTFFPEVNWSEWRLIERQNYTADFKNEYPYEFRIYKRLI
jgi:dihydrofolate reductase